MPVSPFGVEGEFAALSLYVATGTARAAGDDCVIAQHRKARRETAKHAAMTLAHNAHI